MPLLLIIISLRTDLERVSAAQITQVTTKSLQLILNAFQSVLLCISHHDIIIFFLGFSLVCIVIIILMPIGAA